MPSPAQLFRPLGEQYYRRFGHAVAEELVRTVPLHRLVRLVERSLRLGLPLSSAAAKRGPNRADGTFG
jgi:hypothetical protein